MKTALYTVALGAVAWSLVSLLQLGKAAEKVPSRPTAQGLVQEALESELSGPSDQRSQLLNQALALDPQFAPARWQAGFVRLGDEWTSVDKVPARFADDDQLAAYRTRR